MIKIPFARPSLTTIITRMQTDVESRLSDIGVLLRRSVIKVLIRVLGGAIHLTYGFLNYIVDQLFAATADSDYLEKIGGEYGIVRDAATYATGSGTAIATLVTTIPATAKIQSTAGQVYLIDTAVTTIVGSNTVTFTAEEAGADGNDDAGISLSFISPITGINSIITVDSDGITGGADEESDDDYRERILFRKKRVPHGGAEHDYIAWAKEYSGVTRAWIYPQYAGNGTIALAFVRDGDAVIYPDSAQRAAVLAYIQEHVNPTTGETVGIPVTADAGFEIVALSEYEVSLAIEIYPNTSVVRSAVIAELDAYLLREGGPAEILYLSEISEAISGAVGEIRHKITSPTSDITPSFTQMPTFTITWSDYT